MSHTQNRSRFFWLVATVGVALLPTSAEAKPWLINAQQSDYRSRPEYIRDHLLHIETQPFDGLIITTDPGKKLMSGNPLTSEEITRAFAPLNGVIFTRMQHNFAVVKVDRPGDFFDDWSTTIENFRLFAKALKEQGIKGIFLDNEEDLRPLFNYPDDIGDSSRSLAEYEEQAQRRGRQIMAAISSEHPEIVLLVAHGPYSSFSGTPEIVRGGQTDWEAEELRGPFSIGLIEGMDSASSFVDGGEVYGYRSVTEFETSYAFRKYEFAEESIGYPSISAALRPVWGAKVSIGFGVYDGPSLSGLSMDPAILRTTLERALERCDDYVWLYFENANWNAPGEIATEWTNAVVGARAAVTQPPLTVPPTASLTYPTEGAVFSNPAGVWLKADASSTNGSISKVEFFSGGTTLGERTSPPYWLVWKGTPPAVYELTVKATDAAGLTATSAPITVTVASAFTANINFQPAGMTPPIGFFVDDGEVHGARGNGLTYGWSVSHAENMRFGPEEADLRRATFCQIRDGATWEIDLPAGDYHVTATIGDQDYSSTHTLNVEGVSFWNQEPLSAAQFASHTATVAVSDGKLTLDAGAAGHEETRICYILIAAASPSTIPAAPGGITAAVTPSGVEVTWNDQSSNETQVHLEASSHSGFANATRIDLPANTTSFSDWYAAPGVTCYYRVFASNDHGSSAVSMTANAAIPLEDDDGDAVPDPLEIHPFSVGVDDRNADNDGDGKSNASEFLAGTDPLDPLSRIAIASLSRTDLTSTEAEVTLHFPTVSGKRYFADYTESLAGGIWTRVPGSDRFGDGEFQSITEITTSPSRFYRLRLLP